MVYHNRSGQPDQTPKVELFVNCMETIAQVTDEPLKAESVELLVQSIFTPKESFSQKGYAVEQQSFSEKRHAVEQRGIQLTPDLVNLIGRTSENQLQKALAIYDTYGSPVYSPSGLFFTLLKNESSASS
ncbi:hypothetical protein BI308_11300 [Roseofilum reptotaenium AO1-A]|uniref:Uncharacterized protein n=2 Tax=Roseofilum TaxID=1233426 RepID=A0A1L9QS71_9CYAN|nr:hypothetical protein BI308_11300 [Roseofilum reptotaenium AO1-A]